MSMMRAQTASVLPRAALHSTQSTTTRRALHTAAALCTKPKKSPYKKYEPQVYRPTGGLEKLSATYGGSRVNYNASLFAETAAAASAAEGSNVELTIKLLQQQLAKAGKTAKNVMVSPVTVAKALASSSGLEGLKLSASAAARAKQADYEAIIASLTQSGDLSLNVTAVTAGAEAAEAFASSVAQQEAQKAALDVVQLSHLVKLPFPLNQTAADIAAKEPLVPYTTKASTSSTAASSSSASSTAPLTHALNFTGYLAPKFTSPLTRFPNYFFGFDGEKTIAHMMVKSSKMWYVEHEKFQMIDLPYLNPNFVATLVLPRISSDRTIQDHPDEFAYDQTPRSASTVHEVLQLLSTPSASGVDLFAHHAKYMQQMSGLIGVPGFQADYSVDEATVAGGKASSANSHRSVLSISPHGLDVGARTPRVRPGQVTANFTALFDHPFLFFLRSTSPKHGAQILFAGVINEVIERKDYQSKYPMPQEWRDYKEDVGRNIQNLYAKVL